MSRASVLRCAWPAIVACACGAQPAHEDALCSAGAPTAHAEVSLPVEGDVGDPHVVRVDDTYYMYPSDSDTRPGGLEVFTSTDLVHWQAGGVVWQPTPGTWNDASSNYPHGCTYWAPSVHQRADEFWLYYTANCRIGVARGDSPLGPFVDQLDHPLVGDGYGGVGDGVFGDRPRDYDDLAIDPFLLDDASGGLVLYFAAYSPLSEIRALRLSDPTTPDLTTADRTASPILTPDLTSFEGAVLEGPFVLPLDGRFHLMYSGNFVHTAAYAIGAAVSDDPFGPFERYAEAPILATSEAAGIFGPGHHSVVTTAEGGRLIVYHADVDLNAADPWRRVHTAPLCVDAQGHLEVVPPLVP